MARTRVTVQLGDVVAAAFDEAARSATNPDEVALLAARLFVEVLRRGHARRVANLTP